MWKHTVINLEETISINQNWMLAANLETVLELIIVELRSIDDELKKWGTFDSVSIDEKEKMLRGCCGLNIELFCLMVLRGLIER